LNKKKGHTFSWDNVFNPFKPRDPNLPPPKYDEVPRD
jgi:hypothetical protein